MTGRSAVEENIEIERFTVACSRCRLADNVKEFYSSACRTCSTIIVPHSTNHITSRCHCCRRFLRLVSISSYPSVVSVVRKKFIGQIQLYGNLPYKCSIQKKRQIQLVVRDRMNSICPMNFFSTDTTDTTVTTIWKTSFSDIIKTGQYVHVKFTFFWDVLSTDLLLT